jgi:DNA ligase-4
MTVARDHHAVSSGKGCPPSCQLSNTTIYLASCLRRTPYITQTLLPAHSPLALVPCLSYWDRASFTHDRLSETVSESQSYPGMRKIVLVESKRDDATKDVIKDVLRVLEALDLAGSHALGKTGRKWFLGATIWDEGKGGSVFVCNGARF